MGVRTTSGSKTGLTRVVLLDEEELVLDGGRVRVRIARHSGRKVVVRMELDADVKVEQRRIPTDTGVAA